MAEFGWFCLGVNYSTLAGSRLSRHDGDEVEV